MRPGDEYYPTKFELPLQEREVTQQHQTLNEASLRGVIGFQEAFERDDLRQDNIALKKEDPLSRAWGGGILYFDNEEFTSWVNIEEGPSKIIHGLPYDSHVREGHAGNRAFGVTTFAEIHSTREGYDPLLVMLYTIRETNDGSRLSEEEIRRSIPVVLIRQVNGVPIYYQQDRNADAAGATWQQMWKRLKPQQAESFRDTELARYWDTLRSRAYDPDGL